MSEMVEQIARAMVAPTLQKAAASTLYIGDKREAFLDGIWQEAVPFVKAALEAMRDPPESMKRFESQDGNIVLWDANCYYCGGAKFIWQAMIDEALK